MPTIMRRSFLLATLLAPVLGLSQTGTNSSCSTAIVLPVAPSNVQLALLPVDGRWFANAVPEPITECSGNAQATTAWFSFTATATKHWIRTDDQGTDDARMEVFSGGCGNLSSIGCFPANGAMPALTGLTVGANYHFRVQMSNQGFCQSNPDYCQVWIGVVSAPVNDECAGAIALTVVPPTAVAWPSTEISSLGATRSQVACTVGADDDVWYRFTATENKHMLGTTSLSDVVQTNVYEWFSGTCGNLTSLACNASVATGLTPGTQYYIRAHSESEDAAVTLRVAADVFAPAMNDECAGALPIAVTMAGEDPHVVTVSTKHASGSSVPCATTAHDVWLSFTAPSTEVVVATDAPGTVVHSLYSGPCGALICQSAGDNDPEVTFTGLTAGSTYYLKVGTTVTNRATMRVYVFAPQPNAACADAIELQVQSDPIDLTAGHTYAGSEQAWYRFMATGPRALVEGYATSGDYPIHVYVEGGSCGSPSNVGQSVDISTPLLLTTLVTGQQYYIRVDPQEPGAFRIAVRAPLVNDDCAGAIELPFSTPADVLNVERVSSSTAANGMGGCNIQKDVWYRFTALHASAAFMVVDVGAPSAETIELFEGACGALTSLGCISNSVKTNFTGLVPGTEYHIRWSCSQVTNYRPMLFDRPVNDEPGAPLPAPVGSTFVQPGAQYWSNGASQSMATNCPGGVPDDDTWFIFTASATQHVVRVLQRNKFYEEEPTAGGSYYIEVFDTLSIDPAVLNTNQIGCGSGTVPLAGLTIGKQYLYRVYTGTSAQSGFCGFATWYTDSDNDDPDGAHPLPYGTDYAAYFTTSNATQTLPGADCQVDDFADDDIWFSFVAAATAARLVVGDATADVTIELFSGTPGNLTSVACDGNILELPSLTIGQTYYARVYSWGNAVAASGHIGLFTTPSLTSNGCVEETCLGPVLVPNPGIEQDAGTCPIHIAEIPVGYGAQLAPGWPRMQSGSSDALHSCAYAGAKMENPGIGPQGLVGETPTTLSRSGKGMGAFFATGSSLGGVPDYFEYAQARLSEALVPGEPYLVSFHVAGHRREAQQCISGLGAALSEGPLVSGYYEPIQVRPDVLEEEFICGGAWTNICGIVIPTSPVDHITIGNFRSRAEGCTGNSPGSISYFFLDDVVVARVTDPSCITSIGDVAPLEESNAEGDALRVYPNPANELLNIVADPSLFGQRAVIEVFDGTGSRVHAEQVSYFNALQPLDLSQDWKEGLYLVMVRVEGQSPKASRVVVKR